MNIKKKSLLYSVRKKMYVYIYIYIFLRVCFLVQDSAKFFERVKIEKFLF